MINSIYSDLFDKYNIDTAQVVADWESNLANPPIGRAKDCYASDMLTKLLEENPDLLVKFSKDPELFASGFFLEAYSRELAKYKKAFNEASWQVENSRKV